MGLSLQEQETSISIMRDEDRAIVYTSDSTVITKLDKKIGDDWKLEDVHRMDGKVIAKTYSCPKKFISFRAKSTKRDLTDEQRKELSDRLRAARNGV